MKLGTKLRRSDAFVCVAACARYLDFCTNQEYYSPGMDDTFMHHIANNDDNCKSYTTHKYLPVNRVNEFMESKDGSGVFGGWTFKDGSLLLISCKTMTWDPAAKDGVGDWVFGIDRYTIIQPAIEEEHAQAPRSIIDVTNFREAARGHEFRHEAWDKEPVVEAV